MRRPIASLSSALLAASLVVTPSFAWAAPPGAVPVQEDDIDLDDILVDDDLPADDDDDDPVDEPEPEPELELDDEMPAGDGDMPMGDYDLEHGAPEPQPEPEEEPEPVEPVKPAEPVKVEKPRTPPRSDEGSSSRRRMLLTDEPSEPDEEPRAIATETEEIARIGTEEPGETGDNTVLWTVAGVGTALGVAALVGAGVGGYFLFSGLGAPTGSVTVTPH